MKNTAVIIFITFTIVLAGVAFASRNRNTSSPAILPETELPSPALLTNNSPGIKTYQITGVSFSFNPDEIRVNKGDTVRIVFTSQEGLHDWVIDEFATRTAQLAEGQTETVEFIADRSGTFEYYCSIGNHREMGMVGQLIVE